MSEVISNYEPPKQYGWVCPKCGAVMSPYQQSCIYCVPPAKPICGDYISDTTRAFSNNNNITCKGKSGGVKDGN